MPEKTIAQVQRHIDCLSRIQNEEGMNVTDLYHESLKLDSDVARSLLALLDGTRDRRQLLDALGDRLNDGADRAQSLESHLHHLGKLGLPVRPAEDQSCTG